MSFLQTADDRIASSLGQVAVDAPSTGNRMHFVDAALDKVNSQVQFLQKSEGGEDILAVQQRLFDGVHRQLL